VSLRAGLYFLLTWSSGLANVISKGVKRFLGINDLVVLMKFGS
jgi:hypothetical protein